MTVFESTPLAGGATPQLKLYGLGALISIHAPRGRGDLEDADLLRGDRISIHAPRGRGDRRPDRLKLPTK